MPDNKFTIKIQSILGGESAYSHLAREDQYLGSLGIDPSLAATDDAYAGGGTNMLQSSGLIRPVAMYGADSSIAAAPLWTLTNPKDANVYVYSSNGSVYGGGFSSKTPLGDLTDGGDASGNGAAYYDNYMYFSRDTTVARYGPLNGTAAFTDDYWVSGLTMTALTHTTYPTDFWLGENFPNHVLHRHSDGRLYIADVIGNQGAIHFIETAKTTEEGDTDSGSTYDAVHVGYGLWPTALESLGSDLAIALYEGISSSASTQHTAKLAFWDTTSSNVNKITWVEFPDPVITALKNINGVLYVFSGSFNSSGIRISRFIGGYSFEQVAYLENASSVWPGAVDNGAGRILFGTFLYNQLTTNATLNGATSGFGLGVVMSLGLQGKGLGGIYTVARLSDSTASFDGSVIAGVPFSLVRQVHQDFLKFDQPYVSWSGGVGYGKNGFEVPINGINSAPTDYSKSPAVYWSQIFKTGRAKITRIRIPFIQKIVDGMSVIPKLYGDDLGVVRELRPINWTNDPNKRSAVIYVDGFVVENNFWLELKFTGTSLSTIQFPIIIEGEPLED